MTSLRLCTVKIVCVHKTFSLSKGYILPGLHFFLLWTRRGTLSKFFKGSGRLGRSSEFSFITWSLRFSCFCLLWVLILLRFAKMGKSRSKRPIRFTQVFHILTDWFSTCFNVALRPKTAAHWHNGELCGLLPCSKSNTEVEKKNM